MKSKNDRTERCVMCGVSIKSFSCDIVRKKYELSGHCEKCQKKLRGAK